MATLAEVEAAFMKAHQAGDTANAKILADEVRRLRSQGPTVDKALNENALSELSKASTLDVEKNPYPTERAYKEASPMRRIAAQIHDRALLAQHGFFGGMMERIPAASRALLPSSEGYAAEHKKGTDAIERARIRLGGASATGSEVGGALLQPFKGKLAQDVALGTTYGVLANEKDPLSGALFGGGGAAAGSAIGKLLEKGGTGISKLWAAYAAEPTAYAKQMLYEAGQKAGLTAASIRDAIRQHGNELMSADALKNAGTAMGRRAGNVSPEARQVIEDAVGARKAGQNERLVGTLEDISGVPQGSRQAIEGLKEDTYRVMQPPISAAYTAAAKAGHDLPRTPFDALHQSPMFAEAYKAAEPGLMNRVAAGQSGAAGELARYDEVKKILDSKAEAALQAGDRNTWAQANALSKKLRETMDAQISGPEYADARHLGQQSKKAQEAIDTGAELAGNRIPIGAPAEAATISDPRLKQLIAKGYTIQQAENLLNKESAEGAINLLRRPLQREAQAAALGPAGAERFGQRLGTESMFNKTNRELVGNSTTTRQLIEAGVLGTLGGIGGYATGYDPTGGIAGAGLGLGLKARSLGRTAAENIASKTFQKAAPAVAEALTSSPSQIPFERVIPAGKLELAAPAMRDWLTRLMTQSSIYGGGR